MTRAWSDIEHARAFSPSFVDVTSLNARVSDAVLAEVTRVSAGGAHASSAAVLVLGPAGAGKTHLFERLRRKLGMGATFVHIRPEIGIESTLSYVLLTVVDALKQPVVDTERSQLDLVVSSALAKLGGKNPKFPTAFLDNLRAMSPEDRAALIERAVDQLEQEDQRIDTSWLELFLHVPFLGSSQRRAALAWLSGREPSELELQRLGRKEALPSAQAKPALRALATLAAQAAPLVIVFDQLENLVETDDRTDRIHAHARVFAELFDEVSRLVLVQMALDGEWETRIAPRLGPSERSRLEARVVRVELPTPEQREELLYRWLEKLPEADRPGPFPAPFKPEDWQRLRTQPGVTPRMLLVAARRALEGEPPFAEPASPSEARAEAREETDDVLAAAWQQARQNAQAELALALGEKRGVDVERMAAALRLLLLSVPDTSVTLAAARGSRETLRFSRDGRETLVFIVQSTNGRAVATALSHAVSAAESGKQVCVVREQALALPPTWKVACERHEQLKRTSRVVEVGRPELARALALHDLLADARSQDLAARDGQPLSEATVRDWIERQLRPAEFQLSLAAAAKDSGERRQAAPDVTAQAARSGARKPRAAVGGGHPAAPSGRGTEVTQPCSETILRELRLASVERVVAEVQRREPRASRARVLAELRANPAVRWFGRTVVHLPSSDTEEVEP